MLRCRWNLVVVVGVVAGPWTTGVAGEPPSSYAGRRPVSTARGHEGNQENVENVQAFPPAQRRLWRLPPVDARVPPVPRRPAPVPQQRPPRSAEPLPQPVGIDRLPPTAAETLPTPAGQRSAVAGQGFDGTWRDTPEYVIINIDGKEMKLRKAGPQPCPPTSAPSSAAEGSVQGRLLQNAAPLVNCRVVMVRLEREGLCDEDFEPMTGITDERGVYRFEKVPAGKYKLTWLPAGTRHWIRRIQMKPDVIVRAGQNVVVKDIRAAQRTIN